MGSTKKDAGAHDRRVKRVLSRFDRLSSDDSVEIVARSDNLCMACHIGKHCERFKPGDNNCIQKFQKLAGNLGLENRLEIVQEHVVFSNNDHFTLSKIKTTAGIVKNVLLSKLW